jgi:hypothetical protein
MSVYQKILFEDLIEIVAETKIKFDRIKNGKVDKRKRIVEDDMIYNKLFESKIKYLKQFVETQGKIISSFNEGPVPGDDIQKFAKAKAGTFKALIESFYDGWEQLYLVESPVVFQQVHVLFLEIYDSIFSSLFSWQNKLKDALNIMEGKQSRGKQIELAFVFDEKKLNDHFEQIAIEINKIEHNFK